jgi:hypothetical protein
VSRRPAARRAGASGSTDAAGSGEPVSVVVRTVFERFPITLKGAFVLRGGDALPHLVRFERAVVARVPSGPEVEVHVDAAPLDVAPRRDLFLPFEAAIADLSPAWYVVRSHLLIDGAERRQQDSRPFVVAWPRGAMRTGQAAVGQRVALPGGSIVIERVDLRTDRTEVLWRLEAGDPDAGAEPSFTVLTGVAGRAPAEVLEPLPAAAAGGPDAPGGRRRHVTYPVPRDVSAVVVRVAGAGGPPTDVTIPVD